MRKKRLFILWELLIAIAIISLTLLPMLPIFYKVQKKELALLSKLELEKVYNQVVVDFLQNYPIEDLDPVNLFSKDFFWASDQVYVVDLHPIKQENYYAKVFVFLDSVPQKQADILKENHFLIHCYVHLYSDEACLQECSKQGPYSLYLSRQKKTS